jgi:hypothetical protein
MTKYKHDHKEERTVFGRGGRRGAVHQQNTRANS